MNSVLDTKFTLPKGWVLEEPSRGQRQFKKDVSIIVCLGGRNTRHYSLKMPSFSSTLFASLDEAFITYCNRVIQFNIDQGISLEEQINGKKAKSLFGQLSKAEWDAYLKNVDDMPFKLESLH